MVIFLVGAEPANMTVLECISDAAAGKLQLAKAGAQQLRDLSQLFRVWLVGERRRKGSACLRRDLPQPLAFS